MEGPLYKHTNPVDKQTSQLIDSTAQEVDRVKRGGK